MPPLENIIWEAKLKPGTLRDTRRPSTTVDESGCIITRGFLIPSRSSSIDSLARSSTSSLETVGTPASPVDEAPPGFLKPTGGLSDAPELQALQSRSPEALCRPSKSDGNLTTYAGRPQLGERRRTWQIDSVASSASRLRRGSSSRWHDDELAEVSCQPTPPEGYRAGLGILAQSRARFVATKQTKGHIKRVKSAHVKLNQLNFQDVKSKQRQKKTPAANNKGPTMEQASTSDAAIASDSEDDFLSDGEEHASNIVCARPNYAERRARADNNAPSRAYQSLAQHEEIFQPNILTHSPSENAIESDDEDDNIAACKSDRKISTRLSLAQIHCAQNAVAAKWTPEQLPKRRKSPLSVSIAPTALTELTAAGGSPGHGSTPAEVTRFEPDGFVANRELRPSRTQPRPAKGVLKNKQTTET
ncbi:hypothetical protein CLAFUW4_02045 [Fulvia fulva]|uniref:Uncharacterized protein n=1 Tax=Passalora fulva TaxID=5499 RepID=A0A9Q8L6U9_PASFU|nr:uncharacterized protein CLAFUR5_02039 [Fulvia fulva]KAK4635828.1 hypothetical protein CLAFUR4_02041 [Fulvia fulva]KAK4637571.1 hypothetical protein CLAFUR0_02044 [Fulvia fulva]UJO11288.1 hypothetical protein CLAFUR5_02039 [Fulvia fulva]WPV10340.1 hypothetical protein CLAFUW4_02045 [Fulvia fulva]WPV24255.1 hypothetical protein CLAFUW7_02045 [Fulvia fulva]